MLMNALMELTFVMKMPNVITQLDHILVHADLGLLEMDEFVMVGVHPFDFLSEHVTNL